MARNLHDDYNFWLVLLNLSVLKVKFSVRSTVDVLWFRLLILWASILLYCVNCKVSNAITQTIHFQGDYTSELQGDIHDLIGCCSSEPPFFLFLHMMLSWGRLFETGNFVFIQELRVHDRSLQWDRTSILYTREPLHIWVLGWVAAFRGMNPPAASSLSHRT